MTIKKVNILGVGVSSINPTLALEAINQWIAGEVRTYVCVRDVHGVVCCWSDASLRKIHNQAGMVTPDGMPLTWICRLKGQAQVRRVYGPELMAAACEDGIAKGYRHFLYGGAPGVVEKLSERLRVRFPGLQVCGVWTPPFRALTPDEDRAVVEAINAARPDIVWVGLSTPKQEFWMHAHRSRLQAPLLIGVGAAFDFHAGTKPQAPRWMQRSGLEWLFRLCSEPVRLAPRYLKIIPLFLLLIVLQLTGLCRFEKE